MKTYFLAFLSFILATPLFAQTSDDLVRYAQRGNAVGVVSNGMSGVGVAGIGNSGAFLNNPAGLGWMKESLGTDGFSFMDASLNIGKSNSDNIFNVATSTTASSQINSSLSQTNIGNFAYLKSPQTAQGTLVYGFAFSHLASYNRKVDFDGRNDKSSFTDYLMPQNGEYNIEIGADGIVNTADDVFTFRNPLSLVAFDHVFGILFNRADYDADLNPFRAGMRDLPIQQSGNVTERGNSNELNAAIAWEAAPNVMVGFSANMPRASYENRRYLKEDDVLNVNNTFPYNFKTLEVTENLEGNLVGLNLRLGASANVLEDKLRIGFNIESPTWYSVSENYSGQMKSLFDNNDSFTYGDQSSENALNGDFKYQYTTPWQFSAGAQAKISKLKVMADLTYTDWSQASASSDDDPTYYDALTDKFTTEYEATLNVKLGAELDLGKLKLRGGLATQKDPRISAFLTDETFSAGERRDKSSASLGLSFGLSENIRLDVAASSQIYKDTYLPYTDNFTPNVSYFRNDPVVTREITNTQVMVGLGFKF